MKKGSLQESGERLSHVIKRNLGVFRGFTESGLEFRADVVAPYRGEPAPLIGDFLLVDINGDEHLLGRITRFYPVGVLSTPQGDEYLTTLSKMNQDIPEDIKDDRLRYNVNLRILGTIIEDGDSFRYVPGVRQLPHLGAKVGVPTSAVMQYICTLGCDPNGEPITIGYLALGNTVFEDLPVKFDLDHLIAKRSFVFARAGYGKSNLVKLLIAKLYEKPRNVGMLIFDPEGEYAFADDQGRPGLTNIPYLQKRIIVFTDRDLPSGMKKYVGGRTRLNLAEMKASVVVSRCIASEKQEMVFAARMRSRNRDEWEELVSLITNSGYRTSDEDIGRLTDLQPDREGASVSAVRSNLVPVIGALHDSKSNMLDQIKQNLREGHIVIVDVSTLSRINSERLAGLVLNDIFHHNQNNFITGGRGNLLKTIVVLEEAQAVLSSKAAEDSPFVTWAKEGRKYGLGALLITQQPGAIANELLSQGDNFFAFHLISASDLNHLKHANSHYSTDVITSIISEPIKGNCYYWSAPDQPFVMCARVLNYEEYVKSLDGYQESSEVVVKKGKGSSASSEDMMKIKTPAEEYREKQPTLESDFDNAVEKSVLETHSVRLNANVWVDGTERKDVLAIQQWNISLELGKSLGSDLLDRFGKQFDGGGDWFVKGHAIQESLKRLGFLSDLGVAYLEKKEYYLLSKEAVEKYLEKQINEGAPLKLTSFKK